MAPRGGGHEPFSLLYSAPWSMNFQMSVFCRLPSQQLEKPYDMISIKEGWADARRSLPAKFKIISHARMRAMRRWAWHPKAGGLG